MIEIRNVTYRYSGSDQVNLSDISLTVPDGECLLLCGASGCGKTSITRLINGLIPHFYKGELSGQATVNGRDISSTELYDLAGIVGSVFQNPRSQFFSVDTDGEVVFGPENIGLDAVEILRRKQDIVTELNLEKLMNRSLFELSGGEKQKIACASVAALLPDIIILDEPSSNLDWDSIRDLKKIMTIWKQQGKTIIISEHRLWYLKDLIDRAVYIEGGQIAKIWDGHTFSGLSAEELARYELRPVNLEEKYIRKFSGADRVPETFHSDDSENIAAGPGVDSTGEAAVTGTGTSPAAHACGTVHLHDFYFTYRPRRYLFFRKRLKPSDAEICDLAIPDLSVPMGRITGLIGMNGAGKSTFLRCLCGLEKSCIGTVAMDGAVYRGKAMTKKCYMVMQDVNHQLFTTSVLEEVLLSMDHPDEKTAKEILASLDLLEFADKHPMALSGGQKQRVAIASALAAGAEILLFDEPTSGLDYRHMREVAGLLRRLSEQGRTVFVSTHDPELIALCCDRVIRISDGRIAAV